MGWGKHGCRYLLRLAALARLYFQQSGQPSLPPGNESLGSSSFMYRSNRGPQSGALVVHRTAGGPQRVRTQYFCLIFVIICDHGNDANFCNHSTLCTGPQFFFAFPRFSLQPTPSLTWVSTPHWQGCCSRWVVVEKSPCTA